MASTPKTRGQHLAHLRRLGERQIKNRERLEETTEDMKRAAQEALDAGIGAPEIGDTLQVSRARIYQLLGRIPKSKQRIPRTPVRR